MTALQPPVRLVPFANRADHRAAWELLGTEEELSPFNWFGPRPDRSFKVGDNDRFVVVDNDGSETIVGSVSWHPERYGPNIESTCWNIGINLLRAHRGFGYGSIAQGLLAEHLFAISDVNRVEASTDVDNIAEQRSLEKAGFVREGVLRGAQHRYGQWNDIVVFSRLR